MDQRLWKTITSTSSFFLYRRAYSPALSSTRYAARRRQRARPDAGEFREHCRLPSPLIDVGLALSRIVRYVWREDAVERSKSNRRRDGIRWALKPNETDVATRNSVVFPISKGGVQTM